MILFIGFIARKLSKLLISHHPTWTVTGQFWMVTSVTLAFFHFLKCDKLISTSVPLPRTFPLPEKFFLWLASFIFVKVKCHLF